MVGSGVFADALTMTTAAQTPPPEPPVTRRFTRSTDDRVIAGVAGGLGRYLGVDPVVIRLALIVLIFFGGAGVVAYGAAWLIVPTDDDPDAEVGAGGVARRTGIALGILALTLIAAAGGFWGFAIGGGLPTAIVVIALGALLVAGAFTGGTRWLIVPAIALALSAGVVAAAGLDIRGGVGDRVYSPASASDLRSDYKLGVGHLRVDLRNADLGPGDHRIHLKLGVGQAEVLVPRDVCVSSSAHIAGGNTTVFEHDSGGVDHDWQESRDAPVGTPHLIVDADIGFGQLRIEPGPEGEIGLNEGCANG
jgi:phage shock protein PspC (stress-responsive transcriptional regulator)